MLYSSYNVVQLCTVLLEGYINGSKLNFNLVTDIPTDPKSDIWTSRAASLQLKNSMQKLYDVKLQETNSGVRIF